jgi:transcriptional regulator with XRE-family HTH domain
MKRQVSTNDATINQRVKILRKCLNLTQKEFAQKICVSTSFQTLTELEQKKVLDRHIRLIVSTFGVNEAWLRSGEGEMYEKDITPVYKITETVSEYSQSGIISSHCPQPGDYRWDIAILPFPELIFYREINCGQYTKPEYGLC